MYMNNGNGGCGLKYEWINGVPIMVVWHGRVGGGGGGGGGQVKVPCNRKLNAFGTTNNLHCVCLSKKHWRVAQY